MWSIFENIHCKIIGLMLYIGHQIFFILLKLPGFGHEEVNFHICCRKPAMFTIFLGLKIKFHVHCIKLFLTFLTVMSMLLFKYSEYSVEYFSVQYCPV